MTAAGCVEVLAREAAAVEASAKVAAKSESVRADLRMEGKSITVLLAGATKATGAYEWIN